MWDDKLIAESCSEGSEQGKLEEDVEESPRGEEEDGGTAEEETWKWKLKLDKQFQRPSTWWTPVPPYSATSVHLADNHVLVAGCLDKVVRIWDLQPSSRCRNSVFGHADVVRCVWAHGGRVASSGDDRAIRVIDLESGQLQYKIERHADRVVSLQMDERVLVAGSNPREIHVFNSADGDFRHTIGAGAEEFHTGPVWSVRFEGDRLVTGSVDGTVRLSSLESGRPLELLASAHEAMTAVAISGDYVAACSADGCTRVLDLRVAPEARCVQVFEDPDVKVNAMCLYEDKVFIGTQDEALQCYDIGTGRLVKEWSAEYPVLSMHAKDGMLAVSTRRNVLVYSIAFSKKVL